MPRIFVSQRRVQQWTEEGRVAIDGNQMSLPELGRTFRLTEAFYVERAVSDGGDVLGIKGRVRFIQAKNRRTAEECPREGDAVHLATRQGRSERVNDSIVPVGE